MSPSSRIDGWPLVSALEPDLTPYLPRARGQLALDIGAGVEGVWTRDMARCYTKVIVFEPYPDITAELAINLTGLKNVVIVQKAVRSIGGVVVLKPFTCDAHLENDQGLRVTLPSVGLNTYAATAALVKPDMMKVNVSGMEVSLLTSLLVFLATAHPYIFVMCHSTENQFEVRVLLQRAGYRKVIEQICPGRRTDHPYPEQHRWIVGVP